MGVCRIIVGRLGYGYARFQVFTAQEGSGGGIRSLLWSNPT